MNEQLWLMLTNVQNLAQMLAAGLIMDITGYQSDTYYLDITSDTPFSTTLFTDKVSVGNYFENRFENDSVSPVILMLNIQKYSESIVYQDNNKCIIKLPLPISCIEKVLIPDKATKNLLNDQFINFANIPQLKIKIEMHKEYFVPSSDAQLSLFQDNISSSMSQELTQPNYHKAQWLGGALLTFYVLSNRNNYFLDIYQKLSQPITHAILPQNDIVNCLIDCIIASKRPEDIKLAFFYDILQEILSQKTKYTGNLLTENIMGYIEHYQTDNPEIIKFIGQLQKLNDIRLSELFNTTKGSIPRSLLLFFLRDTMNELLDFEAKNPKIKLSPADLSLAVLLFSARTGYISLSLACKSIKPLSDFVTAIMAQTALAKTNTSDLTPFYPPRYFLKSEEMFNLNETYAKELAKQLRWPSSSYKFNILRLPMDFISKVKKDEKSPFFVIQNGQIVTPLSIPLVKDTKYSYIMFMKLLAAEREIPATIDEKTRKKLVKT